MFREKRKKKNQFKQKPLHTPGESIQKEIDRVLNEQIVFRCLGLGVLLAFTIFEWIHYLFKTPFSPLLLTVITISYSIYFFWFTRKTLPHLKSLNMGLIGEKLVAEYLEELRSQDCFIFHDIDCESFNIDHIVVSPQGIFVIETKTFRKPERGSPIVEFNGEEILVNNRKPERNPIEQVCALRNWLRDFLYENTGHQYPIFGIVLIPEWYVIKKGNKGKEDIKVFNPKVFLSFMKKCPVVLQKEDIFLISSRISDFVRKKS